MNNHQDNIILKPEGDLAMQWSRPLLFQVRNLRSRELWDEVCVPGIPASVCETLSTAEEHQMLCVSPYSAANLTARTQRLPEPPSCSHHHPTSHLPFPATLPLRAGCPCSFSLFTPRPIHHSPALKWFRL